ncbi:MAG TPA: GNAT family N-acetyltransferase, partial [Thermoplasmata archaeon]|nr:GNAT family N-acetyltransferase [Thermoplasmata archaeon]
YVWDLEIDEPHRSKGYGEQTLWEIERRARSMGKKRIVLHVFGDNDPAITLYKKVGYRPASLIMTKPLRGTGDPPGSR